MKQSTSRKESNMSLLEELEALANRVDVLAQSLCLSVGVESDRHEATEIAKAIRALIASSREEEKPRDIAGEIWDVLLPWLILGQHTKAYMAMRAKFPYPPKATSRMCPVKHGAEHEMELCWYCETCGHREPADEESSAGTEGPGLLGEAISACIEARSALDYLMGDSDLPNDDSEEMTAMQMLSAVIARYKSQSK